jgi:purine-cytosine permease-like protein
MLLPIGYFFFGSILIGMLTMRVASREGLSQNLLSRGLGFGSRGAAVTSFIYAVNYIYYFLFEGTIVSHALATYFHVPINSIGGVAIFAVLGLINVALVWRGMHAMSFLQSWGFPVFLVLLAIGMWKLGASHNVAGLADWHATHPAGQAAMWSALSLANGQMIFQGLMATDYGRFAARDVRYRDTPTDTRHRRALELPLAPRRLRTRPLVSRLAGPGRLSRSQPVATDQVYSAAIIHAACFIRW